MSDFEKREIFFSLSLFLQKKKKKPTINNNNKHAQSPDTATQLERVTTALVPFYIIKEGTGRRCLLLLRRGVGCCCWSILPPGRFMGTGVPWEADSLTDRQTDRPLQAC